MAMPPNPWDDQEEKDEPSDNPAEEKIEVATLMRPVKEIGRTPAGPQVSAEMGQPSLLGRVPKGASNQMQPGEHVVRRSNALAPGESGMPPADAGTAEASPEQTIQGHSVSSLVDKMQELNSLGHVATMKEAIAALEDESRNAPAPQPQSPLAALRAKLGL